MEIIIGKTAGFCFGVKRAVEGAKQLAEKEKKVYCLGELVHNRQVIKNLETAGMTTIEDLEEMKEKTQKVIFRSHGVAKEIYEKAQKEEIAYEDLTCPKVIYLHKLAQKYTKEGYFVILLGSKVHPENIGTISYCRKEDRFCMEGLEDTEELKRAYEKSKRSKIVLLVQTTHSLEKFERVVKELKNYYPEIVIENTICASTRLRQEETSQLAKEVDKMIVIGGKNSSNTKKLYEVATKEGKQTYLIETFEELKKEDFQNCEKVGVMAGASTPPESIQDVVSFLQKC